MDRGAWWATVHEVADSDTTEQLHNNVSHYQHHNYGNINELRKIGLNFSPLMPASTWKFIMLHLWLVNV